MCWRLCSPTVTRYKVSFSLLQHKHALRCLGQWCSYPASTCTLGQWMAWSLSCPLLISIAFLQHCAVGILLFTIANTLELTIRTGFGSTFSRENLMSVQYNFPCAENFLTVVKNLLASSDRRTCVRNIFQITHIRARNYNSQFRPNQFRVRRWVYALLYESSLAQDAHSKSHNVLQASCVKISGSASAYMYCTCQKASRSCIEWNVDKQMHATIAYCQKNQGGNC